MRRNRIAAAVVAALTALVVLPSVAHAQSAIAGVVRDTSGGVLPGVTVEASSDVLIEKVRSVVSDGQGQYKIVDLRPGTYVVTFTLPGFQTFRRENVQLPANFTSTINAEMRVGALEESVTVSAQSPIVDVQSAVHTSTLDREALDNIPTGKTIQGLGQLVVGVNLNLPDTGGARGAQQTYMSTHGMNASQTTVMVDGLTVNGLQADGAVQMYINTEMSQEVSYQTSGISAENSAGGVKLNMIPREGGNTFSGSLNASYRPGDWQSDNVTQRLIDRGLAAGGGNATDKIAEYTVGQGGPIMKDKLWFFLSGRYFRVNNFIANTFFDDGSQGIDDQLIKSALLRLTWQATPKNKLSAYFDEVDKYRGHDMQSLYDPEETGIQWFSPAYHTDSAKWTSTATSKLLLEAGFSNNSEDYTNSYQDGIDKPYGSAEWYGTAAHYETQLGGSNTAGRRNTQQLPVRKNVQASASYVTGSHNVKTGVQYQWGKFDHTYHMNADLYQYYRSASTGVPFSVPAQVAVHNTPLAIYGEKLNADVGIYAQDAWTLKRLTLNYGLRWEHVNAQVTAASSPAGRFAPARNFDEILNVPNWSNFAPRFAAVYDVFGDARTAIKYSLNRYNASVTTGIADNYTPLAIASKTLTWSDLNGDDIAQGELGCVYKTPGCEINFASLPSNFGERALNEYGAYPRTWNLESGLEIQHEFIPQLSATVSWFHGNFHNLTTTINRTLQYRWEPGGQSELRAVHRVQPAHRRSDHGLRPERRRRRRARGQPRHGRSQPRSDLQLVQLRVPPAAGRRRPDLRRPRRGAAARRELHRARRPQRPALLQRPAERHPVSPELQAGRVLPAALRRHGERRAPEQRESQQPAGDDVHRHDEVSRDVSGAVPGKHDDRTGRRDGPVVAHDSARARGGHARGANHAARSQVRQDLPGAALQRRADPGDLQRQQLRRHRQLRLDERAVGHRLPETQLDHARSLDRRRRTGALVVPSLESGGSIGIRRFLFGPTHNSHRSPPRWGPVAWSFLEEDGRGFGLQSRYGVTGTQDVSTCPGERKLGRGSGALPDSGGCVLQLLPGRLRPRQPRAHSRRCARSRRDHGERRPDLHALLLVAAVRNGALSSRHDAVVSVQLRDSR